MNNETTSTHMRSATHEQIVIIGIEGNRVHTVVKDLNDEVAYDGIVRVSFGYDEDEDSSYTCLFGINSRDLPDGVTMDDVFRVVVSAYQADRDEIKIFDEE
jgi:hypothetical protein